MIQYNNQAFLSKMVYSEIYGEVLLASEKLNASLLDDKGAYINKEAEIIDEQIFYFVPDNYFSLNEKVLIKKIEAEIV
ncbi:MAG: hypothetical protein RBT46_08180 [Weeksellaceae bacterium]|jgi:hypothetical protein|nr:hypothetical protein [Weeksellaceae bacterium]MDX9705665.1 hypothetical protein [Weeksellaceae bacterium]